MIEPIFQWLSDKAIALYITIGSHYGSVLAICRYLIPILALIIFLRCAISLFREPSTPEIWGSLTISGGVEIPLYHWENTIGRAGSADIRINVPTVSRSHGALIRDDKGNLTVYDIHSKTGIEVNRRKVKGCAPVKPGQIITVGGLDMVFMPLDKQGEREQAKARRFRANPVSQSATLLLLTLLQLVLSLSFLFSGGENPDVRIQVGFLGLILLSWLSFIVTRILRRRAFEVETLALLLSTAGFAVCATSAAYDMLRQVVFLAAGILLFFLTCIFLRDINLTKKLKMPVAIGGLLLLAVNLLLSKTVLGAKNWLAIGGVSFQPSEFVKICFIFVGAATLDRLFTRKNLIVFVGFAGCCVLALVLMSDFGTGLVFFITYLVIAFMRSGSIGTVFLSLGGAGLAGLLAITAKPYIKSRFTGWRHAWDYPYDSGYQQVRTMSAAASGGLFGLGAGNGWLETIVAANTDMVFGIICEEEGLIFGLILIACLFLLGICSLVYSGKARSSFTVICSSAASAMLIFQMGLNVLGSMDILPFTGVTFPFVSRGGSSLVACWGILAFIKACDTRQNASFTVKLPGRIKKQKTAALPAESDTLFVEDMSYD
ncbi:MAG: FtsW/RodA/SpoVE family cell cycle protein [Oscillospiraceae bacterium]|nr:FtsW/RodA/SpoVE family cell cycle protein [Oscillospiraceae bacterium]